MKINELRPFAGEEYHHWFFQKTTALEDIGEGFFQKTTEGEILAAQEAVDALRAEFTRSRDTIQGFTDENEIKMACVYCYALERAELDCDLKTAWLVGLLRCL